MQCIYNDVMETYPVTRMKDLAVEDRPREKIKKQGVHSLSDSELLAILIGTGTRQASALDLARIILKQCQNDLHRLARLGLSDYRKLNGIGQAKAMRIMAAFELTRRRKQNAPVKRPKIRCSRDAYQLLEENLADLDHEEFWILLLNRANQLILKKRISQGGISGTVTDVRLILRAAVEVLASGLILAHNHPSGNLSPSEADLKITQKIKDAARMMELSLLDHLIISEQGYTSLADDNLMG